MDIDPTVASNIVVPRMPTAQQTLADAMRIRDAKEQAERQRKEQAYIDQERARKQQEDMKVRLSFEGFRKPDGSPDETRIINDVQRFAPERAMKLQQDFGTLRNQQTQRARDEFALRNERFDRAANVLGSIDPKDPQKAALDYEVAIPYIKSIDPDMAAFLGDKWDPATSPHKIQAAIASARSLGDQLRERREAENNMLNGNRDEALGRMAALVTNQQSMDDFIAWARRNNYPEEQLRMIGTTYDGKATPAIFAQLGLTKAQKTEADLRAESLRLQQERERRLNEQAAKGGGGGGGTPSIGAAAAGRANDAYAARIDEIDEQEEAKEITPEEANRLRARAHQRYQERIKGAPAAPFADTQAQGSDGSGTGHDPQKAGQGPAAGPAAGGPAVGGTGAAGPAAPEPARSPRQLYDEARRKAVVESLQYAAAPPAPAGARLSPRQLFEESRRKKAVDFLAQLEKSAGPVDPKVEQALAKVGPGVHTLANGKSYLKTTGKAIVAIN